MVAEAQPESEYGGHMALSAGPLCESCQPSLDYRNCIADSSIACQWCPVHVHVDRKVSLLLVCSLNTNSACSAL